MKSNPSHPVSFMGMPPAQRSFYPLLVIAASFLCYGVTAPGAIAQVTNQSDVSGTNPDYIYDDRVELPENAEFSEAGNDLADRIAEAYEACAAATEENAVYLPNCPPCSCLEQLLTEADSLLNRADQQWNAEFQEVRDRRIW